MPKKRKRRAKKVRGDKAQKALVQKKKQLIKKATLRDDEVTVIEIRVRPPHSALLSSRRLTLDPAWPPRPKDLDVSDYDGDLRDPIEIRNTDMKDVPRIMDMDKGDRIPV